MRPRPRPIKSGIENGLETRPPSMQEMVVKYLKVQKCPDFINDNNLQGGHAIAP